MSKAAYGFLSPQPYMQQAIADMNQRIDVEVIEARTWDRSEIDSIAEQCRDKGIRSVGGFAQKDAFHHILINEALGNKVPSRLSFLYCMNKYLMRTLDTQGDLYFDYVDPMNESDEEIIAKIKEWPFMLKNTSLSLGRGIFKIKDEDDLRAVLADYRSDTVLQDLIKSQYASYLEGVDAADLPPVIPPFVAETLVDMNVAIEYCYEGYITPEGKLVHYALTEEVYFSNHQALGYVTPPISIDEQMAEKIGKWAETYMQGFIDLGYVNQFFNLEFWIMPDGTINLVEINPRAAHSYHYNYFYSFGNSLYEDNFKLAAGEPVGEDTPWTKWREGRTGEFTLIALITAKQTGPVSEIIDYDYVRQLEEDEGVLIRHTRQRDDVLTEGDMTAAGVMIMQMWLTGETREDIIRREHEVRAKIYKIAQSDAVYPDYWNV